MVRCLIYLISRFYSRQGTYTLVGWAIFNTGQIISTQTTFFVTDTSPPTAPSSIHDEGATTNDPTRLIGSWSAASDPQSGIQEYRYCIGTSPGLDNIVSWRSNGLSTSVTHTGLSLTDGTTYYFTVKAVNGAGGQSSPASSDGITYRVVSSSLRITAAPSAISFSRDTATSSTTLNLQVLGASGVTLNRLIKRFTYSDGTTEGFPAETISLSISAGSTLEQIKEVVITPTLRTRVLAGRTVGTFTITYEFSGYDAYSNPVRASVSILVELRSTASEGGTIFSVSAISLAMPAPHPGSYNLSDVVYPNLVVTATGEGTITGRVFVDSVCIGEFNQRISGRTTLRIGTLTTSVSGRHTIRVELTGPSFFSAEASYNVTGAADTIASLSELLLLDGVARLIGVDVTAVPGSPGRYTLNGIGTISLIPLGINLPVNISDLQIILNPDDLTHSTLQAGRVYARDLADRLFDLFSGLLPIKELNFGLVSGSWKLTLVGAVRLPAVLGITDEFDLGTTFDVSTEGVIGTASATGSPLCRLDLGIFNLRVRELTLRAFVTHSTQRFALSSDVDFSIPSLPALGVMPLEDMRIDSAGSFLGSITLPSAPGFTIGDLNITLPRSISFDGEGIIANGTGSIQVAGQRIEVSLSNFKIGMHSPPSILSGSATISSAFNIPIGDVVRLSLPTNVTLTRDGLVAAGAGSISVSAFGSTYTATVNFRDLGIGFAPLALLRGSAEIRAPLRIPLADISALQLPSGISFDRSGITVTGTGSFNIADVGTANVDFADLLIGFSPFGIRSGSATLRTAFNIPLGDIGSLSLPVSVQITSDGLAVSGTGGIRVNLLDELHTATVSFRDLGIGFSPLRIRSGSAQIQTSLRIPIGDTANLRLPTGIGFNREGINIVGTGSFNIEDIATVTARFDNLLLGYSTPILRSGTATISTNFSFPLGELATFTMTPGVKITSDGIRVIGSGSLALKDAGTVGLNFDNVRFNFDRLWIEEGNISFDTPFTFKIMGTGSSLSWKCYKQNATITTTELGDSFGLLLNLPAGISLNRDGFGISGTASMKLKFGEYDFTLGADFRDSFRVAVSPSVNVAAGSVHFLYEGTDFGCVDSTGLHVNWEDLLARALLDILPAEVPLPSRDIAYLKIRDARGSLTVRYESVAGGRRIYTPGTQTVDLCIPPLKGSVDETPTVRCQFDVVFNSDFVPMYGTATARFGTGTMSLAERLGIPITVQEIRYRYPQGGAWSLNLDGQLNLPFTLSGAGGTTTIVLRDIGITSGGLVGTVTCGSYTETHSTSERYIGSFTLSGLTLKINGARANLGPGPREFKISGDIETDLLKEKEHPDRLFTIHFAMGVSTGGVVGTVTLPDTFDETIDLALAEFEIRRLNGDTGSPLTIGFALLRDNQNITVQMDGILKIPALADDFVLSLNDLTIDKTGIRVGSISVPAAHSLAFNMFGLDFRIHDIADGTVAYPGISNIRINESRNLSLTLAGEFSLMGIEGTVTFHSLMITSAPSISGTFIPSPALEVIPDILKINQFAFGAGSGPSTFYCNVSGTLTLPAPIDCASAFTFAINSSGEGSFGATITPTSVPAVDFYILQMKLTQIALNIQFNSGGLLPTGSSIGVGANLKYRKEGSWSTDATPIEFTVDFAGNINLTGVSIRADTLSFLPAIEIPDDTTSYRGIDFAIGYLGISSLGFRTEPATRTSPAKWCFSINGALGLKVDGAVSGGIKFEGFTLKVPKNGDMSNIDIDYGTILSGKLKVVDIITCSVGSVTIITSSTDLDITKPAGFTGVAPTGTSSYEALGSHTETVRVSYYYKFADIAINIADTVSGNVEEICVYKSAGFNLSIKNAEFNMEAADFGGSFIYTESGDATVLFAGRFKIQTISGGAVGKFSRNSFGIFVYAGGLSIPLGPIFLNKVGGGFFYRPEQRDIDMVVDIALPKFDDVVSKAAGNIKRPSAIVTAQARTGTPTLFSAHLFAGVSFIDGELVYVDALLTLTSNYFELLGYAKVLKKADPGLNIKGTGYFEYCVYAMPEDTLWAVLGGANLKVISLIDVGMELFVGEPGFMISGEVKWGFDIWILSGGVKFEMMVWYETIGDPTFGGYCSGALWGSLLAGLFSAEAGLEGALLCEPRPFKADIILGAYLQVSAVWCVVKWRGDIWISIGLSGIDGGTGRNSRLQQALADARNMRDAMDAARAEVLTAIEALQGDMAGLSPETRELLGVMLVGLEATDDLSLSYAFEYLGAGGVSQRPEVCNNILNNILWDRRTRDLRGLKQERDDKKRLFDQQISIIGTQTEQIQPILDARLPEFEEIPPIEAQAAMLNPVGGKQYQSVSIDGRQRNIQVGFDLNQQTASQNEQKTEQKQQDAQEFIKKVLEHVDKYEELIKKTDELLYGREGGSDPTLIGLAGIYTSCFANIMEYYEKYLYYLDGSEKSAMDKRRELFAIDKRRNLSIFTSDLETVLQSQV